MMIVIVVIRCPPPTPTNGTFDCDSNEFIRGTNCSLHCHDNYCYETTNSMMCLSSYGSIDRGEWSETDLTCIRK